MSFQPEETRLGKHLRPGDEHYRAFIGPPTRYDLVSAAQFTLLTFLGLREDDTLLDIGCGSLRGGKLFISYLLPGNYYGIEPNTWLIEQGIDNEIGADLIRIKQPTFDHNDTFTLSVFGRTFDFILAQSIFTHTSQAQIRACLAEAAQVMKPESLFLANFFEGEEDYPGDEWYYPDCVTYTTERMIALANEQGFRCYPLAWPHPNGQTWVAIVRNEYTGNVSQFAREQVPALAHRLESCQRRLFDVQSHPYVRIGLAIQRLLRRRKRGNWIKPV